VKRRPGWRDRVRWLFRRIGTLSPSSGHFLDINGQPFLTTGVVFGRMGVDLFCVLSGFLLFRPARAHSLISPGIVARSFDLRRVFRWPGYSLTLVVMLLLFAHHSLQPVHRAQLGLFLVFCMDSSRQTWQRLNGLFWTLATEWQFHMLLSWLAWGFAAIVKHLATSSRQHVLTVPGCCSGLIVCGWSSRARVCTSRIMQSRPSRCSPGHDHSSMACPDVTA